ncbi:hypothetical protein VTN77DRAFT_9544 [Rasamsonia byssochlamydoides]|uniref:uncharacterized protein n=1 Tax=Rasamsonia byssochlamydoides TaxID=89139 RepID=UPI0037439A67
MKTRTLTEVMRHMKGKDFCASERSYKTQLRRWGYMKSNTENFTERRPMQRQTAGAQVLPGVGSFSPTIANRFVFECVVCQSAFSSSGVVDV